MKRVRKASKRAAFYNDGPVVFLYDSSHVSAIRESGAEILEGYGDRTADDPALLELASQGQLLIYELYQDDEVEIELIVADKISADERAQLSAHTRCPAGWLWLPTGRLFLDGYNTLRAGNEEITDQGASVAVPSGHYSVVVYVCNGELAENSDHPQDVLLLRPLKRKPTGLRPAIMRDRTSTPQSAEVGVGYGKITDNVFNGLVYFIPGTDLFAVNMDPKTKDALHLRAGSTFSFEIAGGELVLPAVYMGGTTKEYEDALPGIELQEKTAVELARVTWGARDNFNGLLLVCKRTRRNATVPEVFFGSWTPVRVRAQST